VEPLQRAVADAKQLAATGSAWAALARLQEANIEEVLLRLLQQDIGDLPRSHQELAVAHAVTSLYEEWRSGSGIRSPLAWLRTAARRKASDLRRYQPGETEFDANRDDREHESDTWDDDYNKRRAIAVSVARSLLTDLGLPSVIDVMTVALDLIAAGEDVSPKNIALVLDMPDGTVRQHLKRGFDRLESRAETVDLTELIDQARSGLYDY
jgi:DNA-directed RNA polymerase specialized sigma24 family protein